MLLYGDESEALSQPYLAHAWARQGADLRVAAPGQSCKVAMMGALDAGTRELIGHTSPSKRSADFIGLPERLDRRFGPRPGRVAKPIVLVLDNGPVPTSKASTAALAARPWITVEWLPRNAPELNHIEGVWCDLKRHHLAHQTFLDVTALDVAFHPAAANLNKERQVAHLCDNQRIAAEAREFKRCRSGRLGIERSGVDAYAFTLRPPALLAAAAVVLEDVLGGFGAGAPPDLAPLAPWACLP